MITTYVEYIKTMENNGKKKSSGEPITEKIDLKINTQ